MTSRRDSQRGRLYKAERRLPEFRMFDLGTGKRPSVEDAQEFINKVSGTAWFQKHFGRDAFKPYGLGPRFTVHDSQGRGGASAMGRHIYVSTYYRNRIVLLHELAHCLTIGKVAHGREYAAVYLKLVQHVMGKEVAARLKAAFKAEGVRFRPKRKLSPETLIKLRERGRLLAAARRAES